MKAEFKGRVLPGLEALATAGLSPVVLGPKDAIALINSNAASVGTGALVIADAEATLDAMLAALALGLEAFRGNTSPIDSRAVALRPVPGLPEVARRLRKLLAGSDLEKPEAARRVQDPLSFRSGAPVLAGLADALARARAAIELELAGAGDNPAIVDNDGSILSTAGFDVTHLALAFETLGLALAQAAGASFWRIVKLMNAGMTDLPRFLTPRGASRTGFGTVQKTAAALEAEIRRLAQPAMLFSGPGRRRHRGCGVDGAARRGEDRGSLHPYAAGGRRADGRGAGARAARAGVHRAGRRRHPGEDPRRRAEARRGSPDRARHRGAGERDQERERLASSLA